MSLVQEDLSKLVKFPPLSSKSPYQAIEIDLFFYLRTKVQHAASPKMSKWRDPHLYVVYAVYNACGFEYWF